MRRRRVIGLMLIASFSALGVSFFVDSDPPKADGLSLSDKREKEFERVCSLFSHVAELADLPEYVDESWIHRHTQHASEFYGAPARAEIDSLIKRNEKAISVLQSEIEGAGIVPDRRAFYRSPSDAARISFVLISLYIWDRRLDREGDVAVKAILDVLRANNRWANAAYSWNFLKFSRRMERDALFGIRVLLGRHRLSEGTRRLAKDVVGELYSKRESAYIQQKVDCVKFSFLSFGRALKSVRSGDESAAIDLGLGKAGPLSMIKPNKSIRMSQPVFRALMSGCSTGFSEKDLKALRYRIEAFSKPALNDYVFFNWNSHLVFPLFLPNIEFLGQDSGNLEYLSAFVLLLGIHAFEEEFGSAPDSLNRLAEETIDEIPRDPFSGTPFRYDRRLRKLWSVGHDLVDDGGIGGKDIVFELIPRVP